MHIEMTRIPGAAIVERTPSCDKRGSFERLFCKKELEKAGLNASFVQSNLSGNHQTGTLRGLHSQIQGFEEDKLIACIRGSLWDVCVDMRKESPTYLQYIGVLLSEDNRKMLYVPKGCAHGYLTLENQTQALYFVTQFYTPGSEKGYRFDDPALGIVWPEKGPYVMSKKDQLWEWI